MLHEERYLLTLRATEDICRRTVLKAHEGLIRQDGVTREVLEDYYHRLLHQQRDALSDLRARINRYLNTKYEVPDYDSVENQVTTELLSKTSCPRCESIS